MASADEQEHTIASTTQLPPLPPRPLLSLPPPPPLLQPLQLEEDQFSFGSLNDNNNNDDTNDNDDGNGNNHRHIDPVGPEPQPILQALCIEPSATTTTTTAATTTATTTAPTTAAEHQAPLPLEHPSPSVPHRPQRLSVLTVPSTQQQLKLENLIELQKRTKELPLGSGVRVSWSHIWASGRTISRGSTRSRISSAHPLKDRSKRESRSSSNSSICSSSKSKSKEDDSEARDRGYAVVERASILELDFDDSPEQSIREPSWEVPQDTFDDGGEQQRPGARVPDGKRAHHAGAADSRSTGASNAVDLSVRERDLYATINRLNDEFYRQRGLGNHWANDPAKQPGFVPTIHHPHHQFPAPRLDDPRPDWLATFDQYLRREVYDLLWCYVDTRIKWPNATDDRSDPGDDAFCRRVFIDTLQVVSIDHALESRGFPVTNEFLKRASDGALTKIDTYNPCIPDAMYPYNHQGGQHHQGEANWINHPQQGGHHPGQQPNHPVHITHPHAQHGQYGRLQSGNAGGSHQHGGHGGSEHANAVIPEPQTEEQRRIMQWVAELLNGNSREQALMELSKKREQVPELALIIWHSYGVMTVLCQEILHVYPMLNPSQLTAAASNRVCNALALLQCVASHQETRQLFLNAHIPLFLYPFLNTTSKSRPFEYLRLTSLGVIGALVKNDSTEVINFLLTTEIIPLCLRIMETGSELSKTVAIFIVQKILLDDLGLGYICHTYERFYAVGTVLSNMVTQLVESQTVRLLKHVVRCFLRLSDNARAREALRQSLPEPLRDATFSQVLRDDAATKRCLAQLLINLSDNVGDNIPSNATPPHM